jgi:hypothetical protein
MIIRIDMTEEEYNSLLIILGYKVGQIARNSVDDKDISMKALQLGVQIIGKAQHISSISTKPPAERKGKKK